MSEKSPSFTSDTVRHASAVSHNTTSGTGDRTWANKSDYYGQPRKAPKTKEEWSQRLALIDKEMHLGGSFKNSSGKIIDVGPTHWVDEGNVGFSPEEEKEYIEKREMQYNRLHLPVEIQNLGFDLDGGYLDENNDIQKLPEKNADRRIGDLLFNRLSPTERDYLSSHLQEYHRGDEQTINSFKSLMKQAYKELFNDPVVIDISKTGKPVYWDANEQGRVKKLLESFRYDDSFNMRQFVTAVESEVAKKEKLIRKTRFIGGIAIGVKEKTDSERANHPRLDKIMDKLSPEESGSPKWINGNGFSHNDESKRASELQKVAASISDVEAFKKDVQGMLRYSMITSRARELGINNLTEEEYDSIEKSITGISKEQTGPVQSKAEASGSKLDKKRIAAIINMLTYDQHNLIAYNYETLSPESAIVLLKSFDLGFTVTEEEAAAVAKEIDSALNPPAAGSIVD